MKSIHIIENIQIRNIAGYKNFSDYNDNSGLRDNAGAVGFTDYRSSECYCGYIGDRGINQKL